MDFNLNAELALPRIAKINTEFLAEKWIPLAEKNRLALTVVPLYENEAGSGKLWPASKIIEDGIRAGKHLTTNTIIDSTSGNFGVALAVELRRIRKLEPGFPITRIVSVIPRTLEKGKRDILLAQGIELEEAVDSLDAQKMARRLAEERGYWYTEQYWNPSNPAGYRRVAEHIAACCPEVGIMACGVGSGGGSSGTNLVLAQCLKDRSFALHRVAVAVLEGETVGGVRGAAALEPGTLPWRPNVDDVRFVGADDSYRFSAALWQQPWNACLGGPSTGFAAEGAMLAAHRLLMMEILDKYRAQDGFVHIVIFSLDMRDPYRAEYKKRGIYFP